MADDDLLGMEVFLDRETFEKLCDLADRCSKEMGIEAGVEDMAAFVITQFLDGDVKVTMN